MNEHPRRWQSRWFPWASLWLALFVAVLAFGACGNNPSGDESTANADAGTEVSANTDGGTTEGTSAVETKPVQIRASGPDKVLDPGKEGPYAVGVTTLRLTDPDRIDEKTKKPREMVIEVWYPAVDSAKGGTTDEYVVKNDAPQAVKDKIELLNINIPGLKQNAYRDADPLRTEGPYPIILFSHGSGGIRFQSIFQTVHLASHGYVVVSVDHTGNTLYDLFLDNQAQSTKNLAQAAIYRPQDVKFMLEAMKKRNEDPNSRFHKLLNTQEIGVTGHSFGGMTSILVLAQIEGIKVSIPQAPHTSLVAALGVEPHHIREKIIMVHAAKKDETLKYQAEQKGFYDRAITKEFHRADRYLVTLERGGHFSYSNICDLDLKKYAARLGFGNVENILNDGCAAHNTPIQEAHRIINHYATALFNVVLRGSVGTKKYLVPMDGNAEVTYEHTPAP